MTTARRRALDRLRRDRRFQDKLALLELVEPRGDDRLQLMFTCCHPALVREAQLALTLRAVCGFTTAQIAHALLASEAAVAQRIARARRKITEASIPYRLPGAEELDARLGEVLTVLYLLFNEGYLSSGGEYPSQRDLAEDAAWLTSQVVTLYPREPEPLGLLALMQLDLARADARFSAAGALVLLPAQDRARWERGAIADATELIARAAAFGRPGPYQLQAAIVACHAEAPSFAETDWTQILLLYDMLLALAPSPVTRLNRAVALRQVAGPAAALAEVELLASELEGYHLYHSIRGHLLIDLGQRAQARAADLRALTLTRNPAEHALLTQRVSGGEGGRTVMAT